MSFFEGIVAGALGGVAAAFLAQGADTVLLRAVGENWLKGPYGPHFMPVALYMGVLMGVIALALSRRLKPALVGFLGPLLGISVPMIVLTRTVTWGMTDAASAPTFGWFYVVTLIYIASTWGTTAALGHFLSGRRWAGAAAAASGSLLGYFLLAALQKLAGSLVLGPWRATGWLPPPAQVLDGLFTGAGIGVGLATLTWLTNRGEHEKARNP